MQLKGYVLKKMRKTFAIEDLDKQFETWKPNIDLKKGGANRAPKFPMPSIWEYLLHYNYLSKNADALKAVTVTLDNMALGGIYDHLARWLCPLLNRCQLACAAF